MEEQRVNGELLSVLRIRQSNGSPLKIFISDKTHLLTQLVSINLRDYQTRITAFRFYKEVDGLQIPHWKKEGLLEETSLTDITLNADIAPNLSDMTKAKDYTISINFSLITGCLEMKRGTAQSERMWQNTRLVFCINKEILSIRNDISYTKFEMSSLYGKTPLGKVETYYFDFRLRRTRAASYRVSL